MQCAICLQPDRSVKSPVYGDCVIESLERIRTHYLQIKSQLDEKQSQIEQLRTINERLSNQLKSSKCSPKRRKTNSFEDSPAVSEKSSVDCLNEAIKAEASWDESFFVATQESKVATPQSVLKHLNRSPQNNTPPPSSTKPPSTAGGFLPRRLRGTPLSSKQRNLKSPVGIENKSPKWTSKEDLKSSDNRGGLVKREWNLSFIQPSAPQNRDKSPRCEKSPKDKKNVLSLKKEVNLRQTRLKFDTSRVEDDDGEETIVPETDATFCGDLIAASPTSLTAGNHESTKSRTVRKLGRNRLPATHETTKKNQFGGLNLKIEPQSQVKKVINFDAKPSNPKPIQSRLAEPGLKKEGHDTLTGIEPHSDSSVCILPSQSNDVILVEDSHADADINIDSAALLDEMLIMSDETSDFLRKIEEKCISNIKNQQDKQKTLPNTQSGNDSPGILPKAKDFKITPKLRQADVTKGSPSLSPSKVALPKQETKLVKSDADNHAPKIIPKWNCKECEAYYTVAGRTMPEQELLKRMKHCVENHKRSLCETPDGFWNLSFPPSQEDDPRYQTFVDKKHAEKKRNG